MNRRIASHYLLLHMSGLLTDELEKVESARRGLPTLSAQEIAALWQNPLFPPRHIPTLLPYPTPSARRPDAYVGFSHCRVELAGDGHLCALSPFRGETESTEWYPGLLVFDKKWQR